MRWDAEVLATAEQFTMLLGWMLLERSGTPTFPDLSGNGRTGTPSGGFTLDQDLPAFTYRGARGILLNGTDGVVTSAYNPFSGARTFEGWAIRGSNSSTDSLFGGIGGLTMLRLEAGNQDIKWFPNTADSSSNWLGMWPGNNVLVHYALYNNNVASDLGDAELWINGVSKGGATFVSTYAASPGNFELGGRGAVADPFSGTVGPSFIWSGRLPDARIKAHYRAGLAAWRRAQRRPLRARIR